MSDRDLFRPKCAGASRKWHEKCQRCGATRRDNCGDDLAFEAQLARRNAGGKSLGGYYLNSLETMQAHLLADIRKCEARGVTLRRIGSSCTEEHYAATDVKRRMLAVVEDALADARDA